MKTSKTPPITLNDVKHVAKLAKLDLPEKLIHKFFPQLSSVIGYMSKIQRLDTENVIETSQVTGQENVFKEDKIDPKRVLTQEKALSNAKRKYNGYFMVNAIFEE